MSYRLEIGLAFLLAAGIGIALWAANRQPPRTSDFDTRSSTYLAGPTGSQALHDVLSRLHRPVERRRTSFLDLATTRAHRPAILVLLDPVIPLQDAEVEQVVRYVRGGGAVLATGEGSGLTECTGWRTQEALITHDSLAVRSFDLHLPKTTLVLTPIAFGGDSSPARRELRDLVKRADEDERLGICTTVTPFAVDTVVAAVNNRPVILRLEYRGGGTITLVADPRWFTNRIWRDSDMPIVALPLLTPRAERPGRVAWDEYHQGFGYGQQGSFTHHAAAWLRSSPAGWAILQLIAVGLVWLAMTAVRFGPARSVIERRRRSPLEHLEALGAGLESAADADTAIQRLALGLRRRLSRTGQLSAGDLVPWVESLELAMRGPQGRTAVRRLRNLLIARDRQGGATRVLQTAHAVEDVWEELRPRPRTTHNAL